uniref:Uncharacterized protein n=1 Tax=Anopheles maculatus TaxID=74869 RepID=A0A182SXU7_9DIPT
MKQTPGVARSTTDRLRIDSGSEYGLDSGSDSGLNPSRIPESIGFDRSQPDSIGILRIRSDSIPELLSAPDSIGVLRSSGVESGILSDSESVFNMWIRRGFSHH